MSIANFARLALPLVVLGSSIYLAVKIRSDVSSNNQPVELTTVYPAETYPVDAASNQTLDAGVVSDAGPEKVRPTPQQLVKEFLLFDLLDLEKQATNPEDKELIRKAIEIKRQKIKEAELSNDFEKNMQKALE